MIMMNKMLFLFILTAIISDTAFGNIQTIINSKSTILNFGVVINNSKYKIYRSERLGKEGLTKLQAHLAQVNLPMPKIIVYMNYSDYSALNQEAIEEYESQSRFGYKFYHSYDYSNRTYLDGHNPFYPEDDIDNLDEIPIWNFPLQKAITIFNIHPDGALDGGVDAFEKIMKIVLNPENSPVLFHCHGGKHRTGMIALAIRYLQGGSWVNDKTPLFFPSLSSYTFGVVINNDAKLEYMLYNPLRARQENFDFIDNYSKTTNFLQLANQYRNDLNLKD